MPQPLITDHLTSAQRNVIDALKYICGYDDWQFQNHNDGVSIVINSCPELAYTLKPDGSLEYP